MRSGFQRFEAGQAEHQRQIGERDTGVSYNRPVELEWDLEKAALNLRKHRISFEEVFGDPLAITFHDPEDL